MREIKFRAWDDYNKVMINPYCELKDNHFWGEDLTNTGYQTPTAVMQFTGLHDRNGKEIYEGDILRYPAKDKWEEINYSCYEVFFHDGDANSDYNIGFSINRMFNHGSVCGGYNPSFKPKSIKQMVVIGNIYENKELLNQTL